MAAAAPISPSRTSPNTVGERVLGTYRILEVLGRGTFATAYLARDEQRNRLAVVKATHRHLLEGKQAEVVRRRYDAEVRALASVAHDNLVEIYDAGTTPAGIPLIAMAFVRGITLDKKLRDLGEPLPLPQLLDLGRQILDALAAVHEAEIVHHDISPQNIMWTPQVDGGIRATLLDFGVASFVSEPREPGAKGTLPYMAPEQLRGSGTTASDIYSLGTVLWWAATGYGFVDDGRSPGGRAAEHNPALPPAMVTTLDRMLDPNPQSRPSAIELLASWPEVGTLRAALVDDNPVTCSLIRGLLEESGCAVTVHEDPLAIVRRGAEHFDLAVVSATLEGVTVPRVIAYLEHTCSDLSVVVTDSRAHSVAPSTQATTLRVPSELHRFAALIETLRDARRAPYRPGDRQVRAPAKARRSRRHSS